MFQDTFLENINDAVHRKRSLNTESVWKQENNQILCEPKPLPTGGTEQPFRFLDWEIIGDEDDKNGGGGGVAPQMVLQIARLSFSQINSWVALSSLHF